MRRAAQGSAWGYGGGAPCAGAMAAAPAPRLRVCSLLRRRLTKFGDWDTWAGTADGPAATDGSGPGANGDGAVHAGVVASMGWNDGKTGQPSTLALVTPAFQRVTQLKPDVSAALCCAVACRTEAANAACVGPSPGRRRC